jgi:hypothetical protein
MRNIQYDEWMGKTKTDKDLKEVEKQKDRHGADCIRYLLASRPSYNKLRPTDNYELGGSPY